MTTLYVVTYQIGNSTKCAGVFTDSKIAYHIKKAVAGVSGDVTEVQLDFVQPGYISFLKELGIELRQ